MSDKNAKTALPPEVLEAQKAGTVLELTADNGETYYFKSPGKADINRYLSQAAKGKLAGAVQTLVVDLAVYPTREELKRRFDEKPGLVVALNNALQTAVGINEEFDVKKL